MLWWDTVKDPPTVPFASIGRSYAVTHTEHAVSDQPVHGPLAALQAHDGQPHLHEEAQGGAPLVWLPSR